MTTPQPPHVNERYEYRPVVTIPPDSTFEPPITQAPTLTQFWRSEMRTMPGRRKPRWAGVLAFWFGLLSIPMLFLLGVAFGQTSFYWIALAFSVAAGFFGIVAMVAGIGRGLGFLGMILGLIGNIYVIDWLGSNVF